MDTPFLEQLEAYFKSVGDRMPVGWELLPDIGLYMDQVVTWLERQLNAFSAIPESPVPTENGVTPAKHRAASPSAKGDFSPTIFTPSMINNYAKARIIPRTDGKKYSREHLALLLVVFSLKRVLSMSDLGALTAGLTDSEEIRNTYEIFLSSLSDSTRETIDTIRASLVSLPEDANFESTIKNLALKLSIEASARSFAAEKLLILLDSEKAKLEKPDKTANDIAKKKSKKLKNAKNEA
jgi:hypothetical protein